MLKSSAFGGRGHIPLSHPPPMASKLAMRGFATDYFTTHYNNPNYFSGLAPPFRTPCIRHCCKWPKCKVHFRVGHTVIIMSDDLVLMSIRCVDVNQLSCCKYYSPILIIWSPLANSTNLRVRISKKFG